MRMSGYLKAVFASVSWRSTATALCLGLTLNFLRWTQGHSVAPRSFVFSSLVITTLGSQLVMLGALAADEAVRRGMRARFAYSLALLAASFGTAVGQWYIRGWFNFYTAMDQPGVALAVRRTMIIFVAVDVLIFGGLAILVYFNRRSAQQILDGVRGAELKRVQIEQRLTDSRLAAARSQIDPSLLFGELAEIKNLYVHEAIDADAKLNALIKRLQATVTGSALRSL
jgi:hypothetical protein